MKLITKNYIDRKIVNFLYLVLDKKYFASEVVQNFCYMCCISEDCHNSKRLLKSHIGMELFRSNPDRFKISVCYSGATTNDEQVKPRSLRFTWSMKTTSSRDPNEIMSEIRKVSEENSRKFF